MSFTANPRVRQTGNRLSAACVLGTLCCAAPMFAQDTKSFYVTFGVPGAVGVLPASINSAGAIAGYYFDVHSHGFVRSPLGLITTFDFPGSVYTFASGINTGEAITGSYRDANGISHGYVRSPQGQFSSFDPPGSTNTYSQSINAAGAITGYYGSSEEFVGKLRLG